MSRKPVLLAVLACVALGAAAAGLGWHHRYYGWPAQIQRDVLGLQLTDSMKPLNYDGHSTGFGDGDFQWTYKIDPKNPRLRQLCHPYPVETCRFTKSRELPDNVGLSVSYADGTLTVEEAWH